MPGVVALPLADPDLLAFAASFPANGHGLLVVLDEETGQARRSAELVRSTRQGDGLAVLAGAGAWSRWLLLARAVDELADESTAGVLAAVVDDLLAEVETRVHLGSVARLRDPAPGLARHVESWLPNARFVTDLRSVDRQRGPATPPETHGRAVVLHNADARSRAWADELAPDDALRIEVDGHGGWQSRAWAEVAWWPRPAAEAVAELLDRTPVDGCRWCGRPAVPTRPCPYCGFTPESRVESEPRGERA